MRRFVVIIMILGFMLVSANALAEWRVEVESKKVGAGRQNVTLGFTAYWDGSLVNLTIPMVVREIDPGSFWTPGPKGLPCDSLQFPIFPMPPIRHQNRIQWNWPDPNWACLAEGMVPTSGCATPGNLWDGISPDNFHIFGAGIYGMPPNPGGLTFVYIEFDVTDVPGQFEFDTACSVETVRILHMIDDTSPPTDHGPGGLNEVIFNKGIITIVPCGCGVWGDLSGDGQINPLDVQYEVNYVYKGQALPQSSSIDCEGLMGDWDCNESVDPTDVLHYVNWVFRSSGPCPCDPCVE